MANVAIISESCENSKVEEFIAGDINSGDFHYFVPDVQQEVEIQTAVSEAEVTIISEIKPCKNSNVEVVVIEDDGLISENFVPEVKQEFEIETTIPITKSLVENKDCSINDVSINESLDERYPVPRDDPLSTRQLVKKKFKRICFYCDSDGYVQAYCNITCQIANQYQQGRASVGCWFGPNHPK